MREAQRTTIQGRAYVVAPLPAGKAITIGTKIFKAVGSGLVRLITAPSLDALASVDLSGVLDSLGENDLEIISRAFADQTQIEIQPGTGNLVPLTGGAFDTMFAGALDEWFGWFGFCLKLNYGPLLAGATAKFAAARAAKDAKVSG